MLALLSITIPNAAQEERKQTKNLGVKSLLPGSAAECSEHSSGLCCGANGIWGDVGELGWGEEQEGLRDGEGMAHLMLPGSYGELVFSPGSPGCWLFVGALHLFLLPKGGQKARLRCFHHAENADASRLNGNIWWKDKTVLRHCFWKMNSPSHLNSYNCLKSVMEYGLWSMLVLIQNTMYHYIHIKLGLIKESHTNLFI